MAKTKISEFSATANSNTDINSINIAEGCAPSNINDAIRELMAELKDFQAGTKGDSFNGPVGTSTAAAGAFTTLSSTGNTTLGDASGDTVTINGTATFANVNPTLSAGTANGVLYLNGSKVATSGSALTFDGTNLGVGNSSPTNAITVGTTSAGKNIALYSSSNGNNGLLRMFDLGGTERLQLSANSTGEAVYYAPTSSVHAWYINTEQMRLTSTGLGIGTSSPAAKLHVSGQSRVADSSNAANYMTFGVGANAPYGNASISTTTAGLAIVAEGAGNITFRNNGSEAMRIDTANNLGLGVTPSAWASRTVMEVGAAGNAFVSGGAGDVYISEGAYYNAGWKYGNSLYAVALYNQYRGTHSWSYAAAGTAGNAISFTQAMTLDASGNLGIGTTSPSYKLDVNGTSNFSGNMNLTASSNINWNGGDVAISNSGTNLIFKTYSGSLAERARIDSSGNFLVNTTATVGGASRIGVLFAGNATNGINIQDSTTTSGSAFIGFSNSSGTTIGSVTRNGTTNAVLYNTTSDYRLKEQVQPIENGLAKVLALRPVTWVWKDCEGAKGEGFIAHEVQEIIPSAVSGEKDAVNEDGSIKAQGMDASYLVATLTAAIQELNAKVQALEAQLNKGA